MPDCVTTIAERAFYCNSYLSQLILSESLTSIADYATLFCCNLATITLPASVEYIGSCAFSYATQVYFAGDRPVFNSAWTYYSSFAADATLDDDDYQIKIIGTDTGTLHLTCPLSAGSYTAKVFLLGQTDSKVQPLSFEMTQAFTV